MAEHNAETGAKATDTAAAEVQDAPEVETETAQREAGDGEAETEADDPALRLLDLEAERDELKKRLMYALAETENLRKRAERDRREAETYGGTRLARDLLAVHDNLARAMDAADETLRAQNAAFIEGLELTQRELLNAFAKHKIEKLTPAPGEKFDPNLHQAMFEAPVPGAEPGAIIEVMQTGFTISGRLLRPAMVGVAKAAERPAEDAPDK